MEETTVKVRKTADGREKTGAVKMWLALRDKQYVMEGSYITFNVTMEELLELLADSGSFLELT